MKKIIIAGRVGRVYDKRIGCLRLYVINKKGDEVLYDVLEKCNTKKVKITIEVI